MIFNAHRVLNPLIAPNPLADTPRMGIRAIYGTTLKLCQAELENVA